MIGSDPGSLPAVTLDWLDNESSYSEDSLQLLTLPSLDRKGQMWAPPGLETVCHSGGVQAQPFQIFPTSPFGALSQILGNCCQALAVREWRWCRRGGSRETLARDFPFLGGPRARPQQAELKVCSPRGGVMDGHGSCARQRVPAHPLRSHWLVGVLVLLAFLCEKTLTHSAACPSPGQCQAGEWDEARAGWLQV